MTARKNRDYQPQAVLISYRLQICFILLVGLLLFVGMGLANFLFVYRFVSHALAVELLSSFFPLLFVVTAFGLLGQYRNPITRLFVATVLATMAFALSSVVSFGLSVGRQLMAASASGVLPTFYPQFLAPVLVWLGFTGLLVYKRARYGK